MKNVLILGGYGNFGKRIAQALTKAGISVIIAGRNRTKAEACANTLPTNLVTIACFDAFTDLAQELTALQPTVVINTCGPFQASDHTIAECCITHGVHYIDLADGRDFVGRITDLDADATCNNVSVISGASTVPALSSAVIEHFRGEFSVIERMQYGISPGQKAERGLATTQGILSYIGKPLKPFAGSDKAVHGWQNIYRQEYPKLGKRWMANCDIPDLDVLPQYYGIRSIQFSAGLELGFMHLGLWGLSWLVRAGLPLRLEKYAKPLLSISNWFDRFGSADGGMHVILQGKNKAGEHLQRTWFVIALDSYGPYIPTIPAVILAKKLACGEPIQIGAMPCVGLVSLQEYMDELHDYPISTHQT